MKTRFAVALLLLCLFFCGHAQAAETELDVELELAEQMESQLNALDLSDWESTLNALPAAFRELFSLQSIRSFILSFGSKSADYEGIVSYIKGLASVILGEVVGHIWMLPCVALLSGIAQSLINDNELKKLLALLCYGVCMVNLISLFSERIAETEKVITSLASLSEISMPIAVTLLSAVGSTTTGNLLGPAMSFLSGAMLQAFRNVALPLVCLCGMIAILGHVTERRELSQMDGFLRSLCKWIMGLFSTLYVGVIAVSGIAGSGLDSLFLRTAKFTLDKSIPVVGSAVSGTVDIARSCAIVIKNGAGMAMVLLILGYVLLPILRLAVTGLLLRLSATLCAPLADRKLPGMLTACAELCNLLIAVMAVCALMLVITAAQIIGAGSNL